MHQIFRLTIAADVVHFASFPTLAPAQVAGTTNQAHREARWRDSSPPRKGLPAVVEKMGQTAVLTGHINAKYKAELEEVTKKNGFKNFAEYEAVAANISMIMAAIDPQTGEFNDPQTAIKKEIEDVSAETRQSRTSEKKQLLAELDEALKLAPSIQFPTNIDLVKKYLRQDRCDNHRRLRGRRPSDIQAPCAQSTNKSVDARPSSSGSDPMADIRCINTPAVKDALARHSAERS